jgi:hypothetical protein
MATARPRPKRRTGDQLSNLSDKLAALAGSKCIASVIRDEQGSVFGAAGRQPRHLLRHPSRRRGPTAGRVCAPRAAASGNDQAARIVQTTGV